MHYSDDRNVLRKGLEMLILVSEIANEVGGSRLKCLLSVLFCFVFHSAFHFLCFDGSFCLLVVEHKSSGGSLPSTVPVNVVVSIMEYLQFVYRCIYQNILSRGEGI